MTGRFVVLAVVAILAAAGVGVVIAAVADALLERDVRQGKWPWW